MNATLTRLLNTISPGSYKAGLGDIINDLYVRVAAAGSGGGSTTVEDALTSVSATNALSANQGRVLNNKIPAVEDLLTSTSTATALTANQGRVLNNKIPAVENVLTSVTTTTALSAAQGKVLNDKIPTVENVLTSVTTTTALSAAQGKVLNDKIPAVDNSLASASTTNALAAAQGKALNDKLVAPAAGRTITVSDNAVLTDVTTTIRANSASAIVITIPNDSTVAWAGDALLSAIQLGAGAVSFAAGSGVTLRTPAGLPSAAQYSVFSAMRIAANEWVLL